MASTSSNSEEDSVSESDTSEDEEESSPEREVETAVVASSGSNCAGSTSIRSGGSSTTSKNTETVEPNTTMVLTVTPLGGLSVSGSRKRVKLEDSQDTMLHDLLQCIICLDFPVPPVYNCLNGHITCGSCYRKLTNKQCGQCKTVLNVSPFAERLAKKMEVKIKCENDVLGCQDMVFSTDMAKHLKVCYYRDILCYKPLHAGTNSTCNGLTISGSDFVSHHKDVHGAELLTYDTTAGKVDFTIEVIKKELPSRPIYFGFLGHSREGMRIISVGQKHIFLQTYENAEFVNIWCTLFGDKKEASKYGYSLKLISMDNSENEISITWKCPVLPYWDNPLPNNQCKVPCFSPCIPISTFAKFGRKENNKNVCNFSLEFTGV